MTKESQGIFELGLKAGGAPVSIPVTVSRTEVADDGEFTTHQVKVTPNSFREVILIEAARYLNSPEAKVHPARLAEAREVARVIYYYTKSIELKVTGRIRRRARFNIDYVHYENGELSFEQIKALVDRTMGSPMVFEMVRYFASIIPVPEKKPRTKKKHKRADGRYPLPLMKSSTQDRGQDLFSALWSEAVNEERKTLYAKSLGSRDGKQVWKQGLEFLDKNGQLLPYEARHYQVMDAITSLLAAKSEETRNKKSPDYYRGNAPSTDNESPTLLTTITELARFYSGNERPKGDQIEAVREIIDELQRPEYWPAVVYSHQTQKTKNNKQGTETVSFAKYRPLITLAVATREFSSTEDESVNSLERVLLAEIHPVFFLHIAQAGMAAIMPPDIVQRMHQAWVKPKGPRPPGLWVLRDILLMDIAQGRTVHKEAAHKLFAKMFPSLIKSGRRAAMLGQFKDITESLKRLGLVTHIDEEDPDGLGIVYTFHLNNRWYASKLPSGEDANTQ